MQVPIFLQLLLLDLMIFKMLTISFSTPSSTDATDGILIDGRNRIASCILVYGIVSCLFRHIDANSLRLVN